MKKSNFVAMIMGTIGGILSAIGMCMVLVSDWNAFTPGVIMGSIGLVMLLVMLLVKRKMEGKAAIRLNAKNVFTILLGIVGALGFGVGMCMVMVWEMMILGIIVGIVGIVVLLSLIPMVKGIKVEINDEGRLQ